MISLVQATKKTVLVMFWLVLFLVLMIFCATVFLAMLQWLMHTEFYLNIVGSVTFWKWVLVALIILIILLFCSSIR